MKDNVPITQSEDLDNLQGYIGPTPPIGQLPPRGERFWVDRPEQLLHAVRTLRKATVIAVDSEFTQVRSRAQGDLVSNVPRLALIQLAVDHACYVVDALRLVDLSPLADVLGNPKIAILLHGAGADIRVLAERNLHIAHYYDLEATCRSIFGQHESSLAAMLNRAFAIHLDKSLQRTDWTRRPLPPAMIAYAARDAEVTLALYHWLKSHYSEILQLHEVTGEAEMVAPWIEPFLRGNSPLSPEVAVADARAKKQILSRSQIVADCRAALVKVKHPMRRSRLLRLIADLSLSQLIPDILPLLQGMTSEERAGSVRALGRLGAKSMLDAIKPLLLDHVQDVRRAAQTTLRNLNERDTRPQQQRTASVVTPEGARSWIVEGAQQATTDDLNDGWKSRLRSIIDA